jgi:hypothetical protein
MSPFWSFYPAWHPFQAVLCVPYLVFMCPSPCRDTPSRACTWKLMESHSIKRSMSFCRLVKTLRIESTHEMSSTQWWVGVQHDYNQPIMGGCALRAGSVSVQYGVADPARSAGRQCWQEGQWLDLETVCVMRVPATNTEQSTLLCSLRMADVAGPKSRALSPSK